MHSGVLQRVQRSCAVPVHNCKVHQMYSILVADQSRTRTDSLQKGNSLQKANSNSNVFFWQIFRERREERQVKYLN